MMEAPSSANRIAIAALVFAAVAPLARVCRATSPAFGPAGPRLELAQTIVNNADAVTDLTAPVSMQFNSKFLYVSAGQPGVILWFSRGLQDGRLTRVGQVAVGEALKAYGQASDRYLGILH